MSRASGELGARFTRGLLWAGGLLHQASELSNRLPPVAPIWANGRAGLRQGDVVVAINGDRVETSRALVRTVAAVAPGQTVRLTVLREGRERELPVQVGRRPGQG